MKPVSRRHSTANSGAKIDGNAERFEHIGRAGQGSDRTIAVLGNLGSGCRRHDGCAGGDVEGERASAAGAAGVDEGVALLVCERQRYSICAHDIDEASQLGGLFAAGGKHGEECRDFDVGNVAGQNLTQHARRPVHG